jgi:hypothetical protein
MRACTERASSICPWKTWRKRPGNMHATTTKTWRCTIVHSYARTYCTYVAATLWRPADQPENSATDRRSFLCLFLNESSVLPQDFYRAVHRTVIRTHILFVRRYYFRRPAGQPENSATDRRASTLTEPCMHPADVVPPECKLTNPAMCVMSSYLRPELILTGK